MALFIMAGKGKKVCPGCGVYNSAASSVCDGTITRPSMTVTDPEGAEVVIPEETISGCGHVFFQLRGTPKASKGGQPGKKLCPDSTLPYL